MVKIYPGAVIPRPATALVNKTGTWRTIRPVVDEEKCKYCNICWQFCPDTAITKADPKQKIPVVINYDYCKGCGLCAHECPSGAIEMVEERK